MHTKHDLHNPAYYNNRELSWLGFNERVLEEAMDHRNPLLERLKFLSIFSSNLDEFFMVRVAGLKDQVRAGFHKPENKTAMTPKQQLAKIGELNHKLVTRQYEHVRDAIIPALHDQSVYLVTPDELTESEYTYLKKHFKEYILPVLTPMAIDAYRPFPMLSNKSLNLAVILELKHHEPNDKLAIVQVPSVLKRTLSLPGDGHRFIMLEDVISTFISHLFSGNSVKSVSPFRITRNADLTIHEEGARDLLREIEKELKKRKWGAAVRLEMMKGKMDPKVLSLLTSVLELHKEDIYEVDGPLDFTFMFSFHAQLAPHFEELLDRPVIPQRPVDLDPDEDLFDAILKRDIFLHHPYESFQPIVDLITRAAEDENVLAIKQTLYRVSGDSPIIEALKRAAELGKQVTVLVELKARFDEEKNIQWAKQLEKAGCHVIYGITGLKTHSKITLIIRHYESGIQRFIHLGTGNYNDSTAKFYTDMGMLTSNERYGIDATNFFNYLSGYSKKPKWKELSTAPFEIRETFIKLIDEEIEHHKKHQNGHIMAKMNSLTDKPIILKLYEASQAGVKIDLIIRGICCLKPQIPGVSETITVRSILGRFLEHSRVFYFHANNHHKMFLSSADWMTRNMEKRIEILFPVYEQSIKDRIHEVFHYSMKDNMKARIQDENGIYHYVERKEGDEEISSQEIFYDLAATHFEDN
ncbi:RNA degradosome polyphosphate kinase [Paenalkalicoccus suaedae]|uniref:Polyphosphate kinase n=1 Tax=Paenalkalicoccus suaedae TaxID=2592382 RepID=A0A859FF76_9BACI|nr:RNA degradosome polyphosphate kinase [Paenalkalicoccus suaedae]QKS70886.1 RNA degradosome polyphosphate kinase [Paenalkalicoccus suaedae]